MATGLTKTALTRQMAEKLELTNKQSAAFLDLLAETAIKETKKNGVFVIPGIGRLVKAERKARIGRNPQTGQAIKIKAKTVVKFRVAKVGQGRHRAREEVANRMIRTGEQGGSARSSLFRCGPFWTSRFVLPGGRWIGPAVPNARRMQTTSPNQRALSSPGRNFPALQGASSPSKSHGYGFRGSSSIHRSSSIALSGSLHPSH